MMSGNRNTIDSFLNRVLEGKTVTQLIQNYDFMLGYNFTLSKFHLDKVQVFINKFYIPMQTAPKRAKEEFDKSRFYVNLLKKLLGNLYTNSKKINLIKFKEEKYD